MAAYYNEIDPFAAAWLRELIKAGLIADGEVDERSIADVAADDVRGFTQCHWFAGIGGWSLALRLAGWDDARAVWTGSCPCQPFSSAGYTAGFSDTRHLWPTWFRLITVCEPSTVFGEQIAGEAGRAWLDVVQADLEARGYAVGPIDLPGCCVGCPTIGQRLWFVAEAEGVQLAGTSEQRQRAHEIPEAGADRSAPAGRSRGIGGLAPSNVTLASDGSIQPGWGLLQPAGDAVAGFWSPADWIYCRDERWRPVEPGTFPLAYGIPARLGRLRGYGNAIVPELAAEIVEAYMHIQDAERLIDRASP